MNGTQPVATAAHAELAAVAIASSRALVLDLDGTLVDTLPDLVQTLNTALGELGAPPVAPRLVRSTLHGGLEASAAAAAASSGLDALLLAARYAYHYAQSPDRLARPYPGVGATLAALARAGWRFAVCTNKRTAEAERLLATTGLLGHLPVLVGADSCERRKPDPQPLRLALERLGVTPAEAVFIGDSLVDVETARAAGLPCIVHTGGYGDVPADAPGVVARFDGWEALHAATLGVSLDARRGVPPG